MAGLGRRVGKTSAEFKASDVANTLWSTCSLLMYSPDVACRLVNALHHRIQALIAGGTKWNNEELCQLHQVLVAFRVQRGLSNGVPESIEMLQEVCGEECKTAFLALTARPSASQEHVNKTLRDMGCLVHESFRCPQTSYSIDMLVRTNVPVISGGDIMTGGEGGNSTQGGGGFCRRFDGLSRFLACGASTGYTLIKRRHLGLAGHTLVSVSDCEWKTQTTTEQKEQFLRSKLNLH